jgi:hypothetical protein
MSGTIIFLAGLGALAAAAAPREREKKTPARTDPKPKNAKPSLKLVGGKDVPLDVLFDARLQLPRKPPLEAVASARLFAAWLRKYHVGKHADRTIHSLYHQYCEVHGVEPTPENMMRSELQEMRGIRRVVESWTKNGKRHRPVAWFVEGPRAEPDPKAKKGKGRKVA